MKRLIALLVMVLAGGACSGGDDSAAVTATSTTTSTTTTTTTAAPTTTEAAMSCSEWATAWRLVKEERDTIMDDVIAELTSADLDELAATADELLLLADRAEQALADFQALGDAPEQLAEGARLFEREMEKMVEATEVASRAFREDDSAMIDESISLIQEAGVLRQASMDATGSCLP